MSERKLFAGFGRQCITPTYTVNLTGYGDDETRFSQGVMDNVYLTCVAVAEGDKTILIYTADLLSFSGPLTDELRERVSPVTGIPAEHIFCTATHSHSGPLPYPNRVPEAQRFHDQVLAASVLAAQAALADK